MTGEDHGFEVQRGDPACLPPEVVERGYEPSEAPPRKVALVLAGLLAGIVLTLVLVGVMFGLFASGAEGEGERISESRIPTPPPRLRVNSAAERAALERPALENLQGRSPASGKAGVRMPIEQAMRATAQAGWRDDGKPSE